MSDLMTLLAALRRPRLLIRAARFGLDEYNRDRDLKRLMHLTATPRKRGSKPTARPARPPTRRPATSSC